ncbi:N-formylglutamate amidohydrolase [Oceanicella actignis]|uniref:N-formylglutamate amidohydrolase n=1 Tax=Oceanicella actignis TaxID=1189325 RepID=UPI0011E758E9|nr:N-formylglutamate amidohydrolase [Oceanicella actignis]TYO90463.1 putative N-formylglutamate amidohydrolase [Oceanicella actignis]
MHAAAPQSKPVYAPLVRNADGLGPVVLACEHASPRIPPEFGDMGLAPEARLSHAAWDPGALAVAEEMSRILDAPLVAGQVSRLIYDCNRPPEAPGAMPAQVERFRIPGNENLTPEARADRTRRIYEPFRDALGAMLDARAPAALVTVHSFTPVWMGRPRDVRLGVLHDEDARLADALLAALDAAGAPAARNRPYGPQDGVTHTLRAHALPRGLANVMIEIRNDLIADAQSQRAMAELLSDALRDALARLAPSATDDDR